MKSFFKSHRFMLLCLGILWVKTFVISSLTFNININKYLEAIIFAVNPLAFLLVVFSIGVLFKPKVQPKYYFIISLLLSIVLYSNSVYFREFSDIITLPMLVMGANMGDLSTSIFALIQWYDVFFFVDVLLIGYFMFKTPAVLTVTQTSFKQTRSKFAVIAVIVLTIVGLIQFNHPETRTHSFNRDHLVQSMGIYNFYVYDAGVHTLTSTQTVFADVGDWWNIERYLEENRVEPNKDMFGVAEDMNVVVVSLESVESFVIGETIHGEEITPFLNELIEESFYFENFYYQTGQGKTSDAEFLINNSLYPLGRGAVFHTHTDNEFEALPGILKEQGYYNASFHANTETFYNRDIMYENFGYDRFYEMEDYEITEENSVGWGMKDIDWIEQSMEYVKELPEPFYSTFLTLTNHFPYELGQEDHFIDPYDSESEIVNQYFPTVRYTDEAMKVLVEGLKDEGLYENTILIMYGDHYGIANSHYDELEKFLGKEIDPVEEIKLERVPLIIHIPGMEGERLDTVSGQIDVMPTILNLLGIPEQDKIMFGSDLFAEDREDFAVLRNGNVITDEIIFHHGVCYEEKSGEEIPLENCEEAVKRGEMELFYSDEIIYSDLFRFRE
ncbi:MULTISPECIES: LTA synthase family protein [Bacillaceae]|uniref:LTA synthase family protein n=1 Tax=Evansella alkalicola TaxID=745819 RepID=A0ABS6K098_9BACI|nr:MULTISPECIES: LTA synthase family protein [Bacillaceae]MBU9724277.1 LTA synthase family protein [Bacillus alkalicola]